MSAAVELHISVHRLFFFCVQILQSSRPEATVIWRRSIDDLGLMVQTSKAEAVESGADHHRNHY